MAAAPTAANAMEEWQRAAAANALDSNPPELIFCG